jgi:predicted RNase H-like HicB family nuclease
LPESLSVKLEYTVKIFPDPEDDGDYIAEIEELKGCTAFGETPEKALKEIETVITSISQSIVLPKYCKNIE